ncbi:hypothetical protein GQ44DRAFT_97028 [Phaeosphaeriaceae sp. PMI808]|nr:hypothetical protein GQ44DRAFT_97028 [Phaeosphaeriaceae sp. PMI808]
MLRSLIPALEGRSDDPVLFINDIVVPERATGSVMRTEENEHCQMDILMLALFGAKERTEQDWIGLLAKADRRLSISKMHYNPRGAGLLEVRLIDTNIESLPAFVVRAPTSSWGRDSCM